jgi:hypothetical protein
MPSIACTIKLVDKTPFWNNLQKYLTAYNSVFQYSIANDMRVTQDLNSFWEIIAHAQCSVDEKKIYIYIPCVPHKNRFALKICF